MTEGTANRLIAVISDVHANRPALEAILDDATWVGVDTVVHAGDVVGYNPFPRETVALFRDRDVVSIRGNHDRFVVEGTPPGASPMLEASIGWTRERLCGSDLDYLESLPEERWLFDEEVRLVHGAPDDPDRYVYPDDVDADLFAGQDVLLFGHTHVPVTAVTEAGTVLNPGSVGQPRDGDRRASYAVLDLDAGRIELRRVEYPVDAVLTAFAESELPDDLAEPLR